MKTFLKVGLLFLFFVSEILFAASPMGLWKTIDDKTGNVKSIVRISGSANNLTGTVVKLFPGALTTCSACSGRLRDKPIMGMTVMYGLKQEGNSNEWSGGHVLDPKTGDVYHCKLTVSDSGSELTVRGYIGVSLFGRSQTWIRVSGR